MITKKEAKFFVEKDETGFFNFDGKRIYVGSCSDDYGIYVIDETNGVKNGGYLFGFNGDYYAYMEFVETENGVDFYKTDNGGIFEIHWESMNSGFWMAHSISEIKEYVC